MGVGALSESAWGTFTVLASIPIALFMGLYMYRFRKGRVAEASAIGVSLLVSLSTTPMMCARS